MRSFKLINKTNKNAFRRTADVRAVGYAELFVLSREDVLSALADHPDAHVSTFCHSRFFSSPGAKLYIALANGHIGQYLH